MRLFKERRKPEYQRAVFCSQPAGETFRLAPDTEGLENGLYDRLRAAVPVIDACFGKIIRLTGDFTMKAGDERYQELLDGFTRDVSLGVSGQSLNTFADMYLDSLLTYGKAVGRIHTDPASLTVRGLTVEDSTLYHVRQGRTELDREFYSIRCGEEMPVLRPEELVYTTLNPSPRHPEGVSILRGLPAMSDILLRIYRCIGQNFDRVGNVRYAVTYKPGQESDRLYARDRAKEIAEAWSEGMQSAAWGSVKDFVAVGDVDIKVIGAENQLIDTEVPVRQLLEQLIAKLSVPPFLLGLNWSTTERMSSQQADILTSELEYYRRLLTPVLERICGRFLLSCGADCGARAEWGVINLQDEESMARSRLYNAQARELELKNQETERREENG